MMKTYGILISAVLLLVCTGCFGQNQTVPPVQRLHKHLFHGYIPELHPVRNLSTITRVVIRNVPRNPLSMDTREQIYSMDAWLKFTWTDEFLTWNPDDFDGVHKHMVPSSMIWTPDITLHHNADHGFERYRENSIAAVYNDGTVVWFTPAIYTVICKVRVKWFPFDIQKCDMVFGSWGYNGFEIDVYPENSADATADRYLVNGVWDMVEFRAKRQVVKYICCPEPYPEVHYNLLFQRHAMFYLVYMVLPCFLLSILSLLVFYLPLGCGEKLTLSITNLLALVVFQQMIAQNMPPSAEDSPVIGTYFMCMIVMVYVSVLATGVVMHLGAKSHPLPHWVKRLFLDCLSRPLCQHSIVTDDGSTAYSPSSNGTIQNPNTITNDKYIPNEDEKDKETNHNNGLTKVPCNMFESEVLRESLGVLRFIKSDLEHKNAAKFESLQWRRVALVCDRLLLCIFLLFMLISSIYLAFDVITGSKEEAERVKSELRSTNFGEDFQIIIK